MSRTGRSFALLRRTEQAEAFLRIPPHDRTRCVPVSLDASVDERLDREGIPCLDAWEDLRDTDLAAAGTAADDLLRRFLESVPSHARERADRVEIHLRHLFEQVALSARFAGRILDRAGEEPILLFDGFDAPCLRGAGRDPVDLLESVVASISRSRGRDVERIRVSVTSRPAPGNRGRLRAVARGLFRCFRRGRSPEPGGILVYGSDLDFLRQVETVRALRAAGLRVTHLLGLPPRTGVPEGYEYVRMADWVPEPTRRHDVDPSAWIATILSSLGGGDGWIACLRTSGVRDRLLHLLGSFSDGIDRAVRRFDRALDRLRPDLVMLNAGQDVARGRIRAARDRGIPTYLLPHGTFALVPLAGGFAAERVGVWGPLSRLLLARAGIPPDRIDVIPRPEWSVPLSEAGEDRAALRHRAGFRGGRLIVVPTANAGTGIFSREIHLGRYREAIEALFRLPGLLEGTDLLLRPHPRYDYDALYRRAAAQHGVDGRTYLRRPEDGPSLEDLARIADLVVLPGVYTTAAIDLARGGAPILFLRTPGVAGDPTGRFLGDRLPSCSDVTGLSARVAALLEEGPLRTAARRSTARFIAGVGGFGGETTVASLLSALRELRARTPVA